MLEVMFSEAAKYSMHRAILNKKNPLLKNSKDVVFIGPHLDIGNLSRGLEEVERQKSLNELLNGESTAAELKQLADEQKEEMDQLLCAAKAGETIRIWKSDAAFSASGFAYVCNHLRDLEADIRVISLDNLQFIDEDTMVFYSHWGELTPEEYDSIRVGEKMLSVIEKESQADRWNVLKEENRVLRAVVNGELLSVPEDFYDHLLLKHLPDGDFILGDLLAEILGTYPLGVSDAWYFYRIDEMIRDKKIERVSTEKTKRLYEQKLKKLHRD